MSSVVEEPPQIPEEPPPPAVQEPVPAIPEPFVEFNGFGERTRVVTRPCSVRAFLHGEYHFFRTILRQTSELVSFRKQDVYNLVSLHLRRHFEGYYHNAPPLFLQGFWVIAFKVLSYGFHDELPGFFLNLPWKEDLMRTAAIFVAERTKPHNNEQYFEPEDIAPGSLRDSLANNFAGMALQNMREHVLNIKDYMNRVWKGALQQLLHNRNQLERAGRKNPTYAYYCTY
ncbi:hypothetical protein BDB00DRAFT_53251 [Zychaea mexicana]|uniref:uncharacterized protein n=1 Tax=Zychaea mexicana TaxID=64656 RepID=UPI0022FE41C8|nr:uncharacterized protein BDB00DRAFT_53251 [Zychaea mexicana]KAI9497087.1 hypothetical protein BDB00DRAFT_53251 [Zychaea mexicana]